DRLQDAAEIKLARHLVFVTEIRCRPPGIVHAARPDQHTAPVLLANGTAEKVFAVAAQRLDNAVIGQIREPQFAHTATPSPSGMDKVQPLHFVLLCTICAGVQLAPLAGNAGSGCIAASPKQLAPDRERRPESIAPAIRSIEAAR